MQEKTSRKIKGIVVIILLVLSLGVIIGNEIFTRHQIRLLPQLLNKSLSQIKYEYSQMDCTKFTEEEIAQGYFLAFVTGYCRPTPEAYSSRHAWLCAVALNCSCPRGRTSNNDCSDKGMIWSSCYDFDHSTIPYCNMTASQAEPDVGHAAADWDCFEKNSIVNIDGKNYKITDRGGAIKGRRFDIWVDNCSDAYKTTGIYKVR
ncbi:MAG: hypothetical protein V1865_01380 [bacterium]